MNLQILEESPNLVRVSDETGNDFWISRERLSQINKTETIKKIRGWSAEKRQFFMEQYQWLKETGPQKEPFGCGGKKRQADWRERNGLMFVDPVQSNLSSWGIVLARKGYIHQISDGSWSTTDKMWED